MDLPVCVSNCISILAMERPVSIAEELATERMIRLLNGCRFAAIRIALRVCSALGMAQCIDLNTHYGTG
jgi:hypothetical protein